MRRFQFRLDSVLRLRSHELRMRRREMALALSDLETIEAGIERDRCQAAEASAAYLRAAKQGAASERLGIYQIGVEQAFWSWRRNEQSRSEAMEVLEIARQKVAEVHTGVRAMELLREKAQEAHRAEELKEELRELDEVAGRSRSLTQRFNQRGTP